MRVKGFLKKDDEGSAMLETLILVPAILLAVAGIIFAGRWCLARSAVQSSAWEGARAVAIADKPMPGAYAGKAHVDASLQGMCEGGPNVAIDSSALGNGPGVGGQVGIWVECVVKGADLGFGFFNRTTAAGTWVPIDVYRDRS